MYKIPDDIKDYVRTTLPSIDGMLNPPSSWSTVILILDQIERGIVSNDHSIFLEIGVFKGKYLSLLERASSKLSIPVVGIDPFILEGQSLDSVKSSMFELGLDMERVHLIKGLSDEIEKIDYFLNGRKLDFIHIDGSHRLNDVLEDIAWADGAVSNEGIVAIDDFPKMRQLEVLEATVRYFLRVDCEIVPFCISGGKLYCSRREQALFYKNALLRFSEKNRDIGSCDQLITNRETAERWTYIQRFFGEELIAF